MYTGLRVKQILRCHKEMRQPIVERTESRVHEMSVRRRRDSQCDCECQPKQNRPWPARPHAGSPGIAFQRKKTPPIATTAPATRKATRPAGHR
jgi:hypothetical protein